MLVQHILARKAGGVETISPDATLQDAAEILAVKKFGALIVSRTGADVAGILSERDIVRQIGQSGPAALELSIASTMTETVIGCTEQDTLLSVLERMTSGRFRHMPVLRDDKLVGVISIGDAVKGRIQMIEAENSAMADMIAGV